MNLSTATSLVTTVLEDSLDHRNGGVHVYAHSFQQRNGLTLCLARLNGEKKLIVAGEKAPSNFITELTVTENGIAISICPLSRQNAEKLRGLFPWTAPVALGKASAIGCGDRLGLATPGHIQACAEADVLPVLAQQSIREMERTNRTPGDVLDDATWAVFEEGYEDGYGADADHLKTTDDIDICYAAGYTMYTIDPSDYVDNRADQMDLAELDRLYAALPWRQLGTSPTECLERYADRDFKLDEEIGTLTVRLSETDLKRAAVKYGAAINHTQIMAEHVAMVYKEGHRGGTYDLEMSVDETDHPTRPHEHYFVAAELERLGVDVTSLAPRFIGDFQKGIDFIGDPGAFEASFKEHTIIARHFGGYKLSIHSGSDKFSVFPIIGQYAGSHVHLKTAGTSFLEALRIPARHAPELFRDIVGFAFDRFEIDRKSYHVTTDLDAIPHPTDVADDELEEAYLDQVDGRQLLHITYGSILSARKHGAFRFKDRLFALLHEHEAEHYATLRSHFLHHIESIGQMSTRQELEDALL